MSSDGWVFWQKRFKQFEVVLCLLVLVIIFVDRNKLNTIQSHLDVDYLHWTSKFPAVSLCPTRFPTSKNLTSCEKVFKKCLWNNESIDCCINFEPLVSAAGLCFTFNSDLTGTQKFVVSHFSKSGILETETKFPVKLFVHGGKSVNFSEPGFVVSKHHTAEILVKINSIIVDGSLYDLSFDRRGCILPGERSTLGFPIYSESLCRTQCSNISRPIKYICSGPLCSQGYSGDFPHSSETHYLSKSKCDCPPSCEEDDVRVIWSRLGGRNGHHSAVVKVTLMSPPTERLILKARFDRLHLLVTIACFSRLFTSKNLPGLLYSGLKGIRYSTSETFRRKLYITELMN